MLRFHLDEHVSFAIAKGLRFRRIDVTTTADDGLVGCEDSQHVEFANREMRVIFTNDADFLRLAAEGFSHSGIVFCHHAFFSSIRGRPEFVEKITKSTKPHEFRATTNSSQNTRDVPGAFKTLHDDIYRDKVLRARQMTMVQRIEEVMTQSNFQFEMMLAGAMHRLGTSDIDAGWQEVGRWMQRLRQVHTISRLIPR